MDARDHLLAVLANLNKREFWEAGLSEAVQKAEIFLDSESSEADELEGGMVQVKKGGTPLAEAEVEVVKLRENFGNLPW
jgi:hypothetical protein